MQYKDANTFKIGVSKEATIKTCILKKSPTATWRDDLYPHYNDTRLVKAKHKPKQLGSRCSKTEL